MKSVLLISIIFVNFVFAFEKLNINNFEKSIKNKNVIVDFYADWCAPCKDVAANLIEFNDFKPDNVVIYKVDTEDQYYLAKKHGVERLPTLMYFKDGKEIKRFLGVQSSSKLLETSEKLFK